MGMGAKLCGSLQDEPRHRKSGPTGSSYRSCWRQHAPQDPDSQRGRGSAPAARELGDTLRPSSGPLPVKTSPRSCPLPASEARNDGPREACNAAPFWGADSKWGT